MGLNESDTRAKLIDPGIHARGGTDGIENPQVFQTPEVVHAGGLAALKALGKPADILRETKERLFAA